MTFSKVGQLVLHESDLRFALSLTVLLIAFHTDQLSLCILVKCITIIIHPHTYTPKIGATQ